MCVRRGLTMVSLGVRFKTGLRANTDIQDTEVVASTSEHFTNHIYNRIFITLEFYHFGIPVMIVTCYFHFDWMGF